MPDEPPIERRPQESERFEYPDATQRPRVGVDTWVAEHGERVQRGPLRRAAERVPGWARLLAFVAVAAVFPVAVDDEYLQRVGVDTLIFMLLAVGLNVVVGYAGLLDLGYIAFFGFGAYTYAIVSSDKYDYHWPAEATIPFILVVTAALGLLLGLPSRRLLGDYLAIVTLFFGQLFVTITNNSTDVKLPFMDRARDLTGGPNGITDLDPIDFAGVELNSVPRYFWFALALFVLVVVALHFVNESRTGRAWRALREDPLAAEAMTMPVNRLKLLAFAFGAAVAGVTGAIFASLQTAVFPQSFDVSLLIILYAMVILGGTGSLAGVALGAIVVNVLLEGLTNTDDTLPVVGETPPRLLFYGLVAVGLALIVRPWRWLAVAAAATIVFGFAARLIAEQWWERGTAGRPSQAGRIGDLVDGWLLFPRDPVDIGNYAFVALIASVLVLTLLRRPWRWIALAPVLYLAAFVWENRLIQEPSVTRFILLGAILVGLMASRPQGLFGTARVEIA